MLRDIRAGLRLRSGRRRLRTAFIGIFGGVWLAVEPAGLFFPDEFQWGWAGYLGLAACSAVAAVYVSKPPTEISRSLPPTNVSVAVRVGDVLAQSGNVVVGAADTFDTQPEDDVISLASVQGQLLARSFGGDRAILDQLIGASIGSGQTDGSKTFGKRSRYPIGTVPAPLERVLSDNGNEFKGKFNDRSRVCTRATRASTPDDRRPTATTKRSTRRSLTSAGARRSRATSIRAWPDCAASSGHLADLVSR